MNRIILTLIVVAVMSIGLLRILYWRRKMIERHTTVADYLEKFNLFVAKDDKELKVYSSLLYDSDKIQNILGSYGICDLRPPFANYVIRNYQIILNAIPEIKKQIEEPYRISNNILNHYIDLVTQSLIRYGGSSNEAIKEYNSDLKNPIKWFLEGVKFIVSLPIEFLLQVGLINENSASKVRGSYIVKIISALVTIVGFASAILGIIVGWDDFIKIINKIIL